MAIKRAELNSTFHGPSPNPRALTVRTIGLLTVFLLCCLRSLAQQPTTNATAQLAPLEAEMKTAVQQVEIIINQPVVAYQRKPGMHVYTFKPGWFHEGASRPNFSAVDVRASQEKIYDNYEYVTSDLNPGLVFVGRQLEFNAATKMFYKNRSIPKKKLTEAEMVEINRLYRIIGRCEHDLAQIKHPQQVSSSLDNAESADANSTSDNADATATPARRPRLLNPYTGGGLLVVAALILFFVRRSR